MAAADVPAVKQQKNREQELFAEYLPDEEDEEEEKTIDENGFFETNAVAAASWLHSHGQELRMATSGDREAISAVCVLHKIRQLRNFDLPFDDTQKEIHPNREVNERVSELAAKLGMKRSEVVACYVAFIATDLDASGVLDSDLEVKLAFEACSVPMDAEIKAAYQANNRQLDAEKFMLLCDQKRGRRLKTRQFVSYCYHAPLMQGLIAFLLLTSFVINLIEAQLGGTASEYNRLFVIVDHCLALAFIVELCANMVSFWFRLFWTSPWNGMNAHVRTCIMLMQGMLMHACRSLFSFRLLHGHLLSTCLGLPCAGATAVAEAAANLSSLQTRPTTA